MKEDPEASVKAPAMDDAEEAESEPPVIESEARSVRLFTESATLDECVTVNAFDPRLIVTSSVAPGTTLPVQFAGVFQLKSPPPPVQ